MLSACRRSANMREFYYRIIVPFHANTHNSIIIVSLFLSLSRSFSLAARLSLILPPTHTHYNSLLDISILITVLSSESIMSAYREVSRSSGCSSFLLISSYLGNPLYSFACTKAKAKFISIHSLFVFFPPLSFLLFSRFIAYRC